MSSSSLSSSSSSSSPASAVRVLTELDHVRIGKWLDTHAAQHEALQNLLDNADLVASDAVAPDVVTMRSRVQVAEPGDGAVREITLAYPDEADAAQGRISVLSPAGTALLGLRAGDVARWTAPDGRVSALQVRAVAFQPEASGDLLR
ncbi:nucleoside diphosphate kinase regulator [Xenophilus azovorans]|uniref:nucleoside diphosphate kinase regulator n=1 Tax=Xenophilus azovorans TaxID=151755 RepID=UPI000692282C|nr:nucleoside diphosphate kinase regulator [Xenophilus azovorans]